MRMSIFSYMKKRMKPVKIVVKRRWGEKENDGGDKSN
jgi:hypothetical protein